MSPTNGFDVGVWRDSRILHLGDTEVVSRGEQLESIRPVAHSLAGIEAALAMLSVVCGASLSSGRLVVILLFCKWQLLLVLQAL